MRTIPSLPPLFLDNILGMEIPTKIIKINIENNISENTFQCLACKGAWQTWMVSKKKSMRHWWHSTGRLCPNCESTDIIKLL